MTLRPPFIEHVAMRRMERKESPKERKNMRGNRPVRRLPTANFNIYNAFPENYRFFMVELEESISLSHDKKRGRD